MSNVALSSGLNLTKNRGTTLPKKVVYVALLVSDQDNALDFYTNVIGLEKRGDYPTPDGPRFLTVGVKGQGFRARSVARHTRQGQAGFRGLYHRGGTLPDGVRDAEVARSEFEAPEILESFPGVTPRGSRIRTGICFRCERVAGHFGAQGA
jgi:catechol 2,3-dioxygenase-like lactoylglutathione lyase family enzyme